MSRAEHSHLHDLNQGYLQKIRAIPLLTSDEEYVLAKQWREDGNKKAVEKIVTSHLRLVTKIAQGYRGYGLPISDLVAEGHVGVMQAMRHFDPERGFRFSTYAMWWIKASIQEYILNSWSLVKLGTTSAQKRLFFKLRSLKQKLGVHQLDPQQIKDIAEKMSVRPEDVVQMEERMSGMDHSLNAPLKEGNDSESEWIDWLSDERENQEHTLIQTNELEKRRHLLNKALDALTDRERKIFYDRRLHEPPFTLDELSHKYDISRERVRQIELKAFTKLQKAIKFHSFGQMS